MANIKKKKPLASQMQDNQAQKKAPSFTTDKSAMQQFSLPMLTSQEERYRAYAQDWVEKIRKQSEAQQKNQQELAQRTATQKQRMSGLIQATDNYWQQRGTQADPTYEQIVAQYYANTPTAEGSYDVIMANGGFGNLTQEQLWEMTDPSVYKPTEDVTGWQWITGTENFGQWITGQGGSENEYKQAVKDAYVNWVTDQQTAMQYGAFDQPQYLLGGYSHLASTDYLKAVMEAIPGIKKAEAAKYAELLAAYDTDYANFQSAYADWENRTKQAQADSKVAMRESKDVRNAVNQERQASGGLENRLIISMTGSSAEGEEYAKQFFDAVEAGDADEVDLVFDKLLRLDNAINGKFRGTWNLEKMTDEELGNDLKRMVDQYSLLVYQSVGAAPVAPEYPQQEDIPYDAVMDLVNSELASREAMMPYLQAVVDDPDFMERAEYIEPEDVTGRNAGSAYVAINTGTTWGTVNLALMTDIERAVYNYLYNTNNGSEAQDSPAMMYLNALWPALEQRTRAVDQVGWEFLATENALTAGLMGITTVGANLYNVPFALGDMIYEGVTGEKSGVANPFGDFTSTVRTAQDAALGEVEWANGVKLFGKNPLQLLYGAGTSTMDMGTAMLLGGGGAGSLGIMAAEAGASEWNDQLATDRPYWERVLRTGLTATGEALTEKLPLDIMTGKTGIGGWARPFLSAASEGTEEYVSNKWGDLTDWALSQVTGTPTEKQNRENAYFWGGYANPQGMVRQEERREEGLDALLGGMTGFGMGTTSAVAQNANYARQGREIIQAEGADALVQMGSAMPADSETAKLIKSMTGKDGKVKPTAAKVGQLYRTMLLETSKQYDDNIRAMTVDAVEEEINKRYEETGVIKETDYTTREMAEAIVDAQGDEKKLRGKVGQYIKESRVPKTIMREFEGANATTKEKAEQKAGKNEVPIQADRAELQKTETEQSKGAPAEWVQELQMRRIVEAAKYSNKLDDITATTRKSEEAKKEGTTGAPTAAAETPAAKVVEQDTQERTEALTRRRKPSDELSRTIAYEETEGKPEVVGELVRVEGSGENISLVVERDGEQRTVPMDKIKQVSAGGIARVIAYAEEHPELSSEEINNMIVIMQDSNPKAKLKSSEVIALYETAVKAGFVGSERPVLSDLIETVTHSKDAQKALEKVLELGYNYGTREAGAAESQRTSGVGSRQRGQGTVTYMGEVENTGKVEDAGTREAVTNKLRKTLNSRQQVSVRAMETLSKATGVNIVLYRTKAAAGEAIENPNGYYDPTTNSIYIDLEAGKTQGGESMVESAILKTASHELTHYIEHNSGIGYANLRSAMKEMMKERGKDWYQLIETKLRESTHVKTRAAAEAEVIADAAEMMLKDSTAVEQIAQRKPGLFNAVKDWLKSFVKRIRNAFAGLTATSEEAVALTEIKDGVEKYLGKLQQLWDDALVEASGMNQGEGATVKKGTVVESEEKQYSVRKLKDGTSYVHVDTDQQIFEGIPQELYAKTARNYIRDHFRNKVIGDKVKAYVRRESENEYTLPAKKNIPIEIYKGKMRAATELNNLLDASTFIKHENDDGRHIDAVRGWDKYKTIFEVDDLFFEGTVTIKKIKYGDVFYDVTKIEDITEPMRAKYSEGLQYPGQSDVLNSSIPQENENVNDNIQYSKRKAPTTDAFKRWFGNSKVVNADGTPKIVYHQTGAKFTVFNTDNPLAGLNDSETPNGMFFKDNNHDIGLGGQYQMAVYLKADNILHFANRREANDWYQKNVPGYADIQKKLDRALAEFEPRFKAIEDEQFDPNTSDERVDELFEIEENLIKELGKVETKYRSQLRELLNNHFLHGGSGYDAIELDYDGHRWVNGVRENVHTYIVFSPTQIKSATDNVGTFDPDNPDIRYSERRKANMSVRKAMQLMQETEEMTAGEKDLLKRYQAKAQEVERLQEEINQQVAILTDKNITKDEERKAKNRMGILKSQQRRAEGWLRMAETGQGFARLMTTSRHLARSVMNTNSLDEARDNANRQLEEIGKELDVLQDEIAKLSGTETERTLASLFDKKKLDEAARKLKDGYGSRMTLKELRNRIVLLNATMMSKDQNAGQQALEMAKTLAQDLMQTGVQAESYTLDVLKENVGVITLTEVQKQELKKAGISMLEFRNTVNPVVKIAKAGGQDLMNAIENDEYFGPGTGTGLRALFDGAESEGDSVIRLYELIKNEREQMRNGANYMGSLDEAMLDVMSTATEATLVDAGVETVSALMDAVVENAEDSDALKKKAADIRQKLRLARRNAHNANVRAADVHANAQELVRYYEQIERQRYLIDQKEQLTEIKRQLHDKIKTEWYQKRDILEKNSALRNKIRKTVGWLDKRIRRETDQKRVPEGFKPVAEELIRIFAEYNETVHMLPKKETAEIIRVYTALAKIDGTDMMQLDDLYKENMEDEMAHLKELLKVYPQKKGWYLDLETAAAQNEVLDQVASIVDTVWHTMKSMDNVMIMGNEMSLSETAGKLAKELDERESYSRMDNAAGKAWKSLKAFIRDGNLTPVYFFKQLGVDVMTQLNDSLLEAQNEHAMLFNDAQTRIAEIQAKHNYWAWKDADPLTFTTWQGRMLDEKNKSKHTVTLTVGEAMSIWAIDQREKISTPLLHSRHLEKGGFVLRSHERKVNGRVENDSTPHKLGVEDIATIDNYLTDEMKAYARELVEYLSKDMAEIGNRTSMQLFGIRKFKEDFYFPMQVDRGQVAQSSTAGNKQPEGTNRIASMRPTKRRVDQATKPLAIADFTEVAAEHVNQMLLYGTFAIPIESFNKVLNAPNMDDFDAELAETESRYTMRALVEQKFGKDIAKYLSKYLADVNGGPMPDSTEQGLAKGFTLYKKAAVMAKLSVAIQQPMSAIRAMMVVDPKYFNVLANHKDKVGFAKEWEQLCQYSGVALIKERGGFDMTSGKSLASQLAGNVEDSFTKWQKAKALLGIGVPKGAKFSERTKLAGRSWDNVFGWLPQAADKVAWAYMWRVVKAEVADKNRGMDTSSEEFLQKAADRFNEVMNLTQVYDSTLVKSQNMRSKSIFMKMLTAFKAEPTLTANMLMDAVQSKNAKKIGRAVGVWFASAVLTAAAKALVTATNRRDDDEEKPWLEKWLSAWGSQLGGASGDLNMFALFPAISDAMSIFDGYDVERADMSVYSELIDVVQKLASGYYDEKPWERMMEDVTTATGSVLGVPAKGLWSSGRTIINTIRQIAMPSRDVNAMALKHDAANNFVIIPDRDNAYYYNRLYEAMKAGDSQEVEELQEFLGIQGKSEKTINTNVKNVVKENYKAYRITEEEAKKFLLDTGLVEDEKDAFEAVDSWNETGMHEDEEGYNYSAYDTVREAIDANNAADVKAAVKELVDNGWEEAEVRSEIRKYINKEYREGNLTQKQAQKLLETHGGYDAETLEDEYFWYWHFREQDWGKVNGGSTEGYKKLGDFYTAVETGKNLKAVVKDYLDHGVEAKTLASALTTQYRKQFVQLYKTNRSAAANLQARLLNAYQVLGYDRAKKQKDIMAWLEE